MRTSSIEDGYAYHLHAFFFNDFEPFMNTAPTYNTIFHVHANHRQRLVGLQQNFTETLDIKSRCACQLHVLHQ